MQTNVSYDLDSCLPVRMIMQSANCVIKEYEKNSAMPTIGGYRRQRVLSMPLLLFMSLRKNEPGNGAHLGVSCFEAAESVLRNFLFAAGFALRNFPSAGGAVLHSFPEAH